VVFLARHFDLALAPQVVEEVGHYELLTLVIASLITFINTCLLSYRTWYALLIFLPLSSYAFFVSSRGRKISSSLRKAVPFLIGSVVCGAILCPQLPVIDYLRFSSSFLDVVAEVPQLNRFRQTDATGSWFAVYYISVVGCVVCAVVHRVHL
jgi:hypothetical protein